MKIVIATPFYPPERGVLGNYAKGLEEAFKHRGDDVALVVLPKHLPPGIRHIACYLNVRKAAHGADLVLALDVWSVGGPSLYAAKHAGVPFAVRVGGDFLWELYVERTREKVLFSEFYDKPRSLSLKEKWVAAAIRAIVSNAHAIFFNTTFIKGIWDRAYAIPTQKSHLLENFYPPVEVTSAKRHTFLSNARGTFFKNMDMFERVFTQVKEKHPDIELDTRGMPYEEHIRRVESVYAIIVPSISEVGSNTVIEGISQGKPFIIAKDSGTRERLGECGIFIDTRNEEELVSAIESMLDPETYRHYVSKIKEFSYTHSWDDMAREIVEKL